MPGAPFVLDSPTSTPLGRAAFAAAQPLLRWVLELPALNELYRQSISAGSHAPFERRVLDALGVSVSCAESDLTHIPANVAVIFAANHPRGMLDGLVLVSAVTRVRPDVRLIANRLLEPVPELRDRCFFVDPFGGPEAASRSRAGLRAAHLWLRQGKAVAIFPSGMVAPQLDASGEPIDGEWQDTAARLARQTGASVVPVHIRGRNRTSFYQAGRLHHTLRTCLLPREFLAARAEHVAIRVGSPMTCAPAHGMNSLTALTARLRAAVEQLTRQPQPPAAGDIAREIAQLPSDTCLLDAGGYRVFCGEASQIPLALQEIGRLRAVTYRAAGEGSGADCDLDEFDSRYLHLFSWDIAAERIVGAYRLGKVDEISRTQGARGLYTRSLFAYDDRFLARLLPALELGRAFVRPEYQRSHQALLLLWKGIGAFVTRHPRYRTLFGAVSISSRYSDTSQMLMRVFLEQHCKDEALGPLVEPVNPPPPLRSTSSPLAATFDLRSVPVLLRQYLKLGARLVAFNVDRSFGDVLDALMIVDLDSVEISILRRYLGPAFLDKLNGDAAVRVA